MTCIHFNNISNYFIYITLTHRKSNTTLLSNKSFRTFLDPTYLVWKWMLFYLQSQLGNQTLRCDVLYIAIVNDQITDPLTDGASCSEDLISLITIFHPQCEQQPLNHQRLP